MNVFDYLDKYGGLSFGEMPFNEVDALMLTELSYLDLEKICPYYVDGKGQIPIKSLNLATVKELGRRTTDAPNCETLIRKMAKSARFSKVGIGLGHAIRDERRVIQYASFTFFLPNDVLFIAYRGTDTTLLGWKEDFQLAYQDTIASHHEALGYAKQVLSWYPGRKFYLGGHSKGGNLASYVTLHLEEKWIPYLVKAYSFDGPGFRKKPEKFEERKNLIEKFLTQEDMIGCFFNLIEKPNIIYSSSKIGGGHNPFGWQIDIPNKMFKRAPDRSAGSYAGEKAFAEVLSQTSREDIQLAADALFRIYWDCETVLDLGLNLLPSFLKRESALSDYTPEEREKVKAFFEKFFLALSKRIVLKKPKKEKKPASE